MVPLGQRSDVVQLRGQLTAGVDTHAYVYKSGAATPAEAEVWLTDMCDVTDEEVEVERATDRVACRWSPRSSS